MRSHRFKSILRSVFALCALLELASVVLAQSGGLALTHVTIIDPGVGKPQQDMTILVRGQDIVAVGRAKQVTIPASVKVIDDTGKFVIPGLWDMHSHFRDAGRDLKMDIANGVLGTRNMGGAAKDVFPLRDAVAHNQQLVACRSEFVTADAAGGVRVLPLDGPSVGGVGVDITAKFAS
jgi:cytosine/adenosine deaminase-related metal-dependent hydrolase